jgi:RalA-binding protein 1
MQRNLSIDSTVSSISSSASQPPRSNPSPSNNQSNAPDGVLDPAALVAQTGSVESALQYLWKEKQNATSHNAQLWRLLEKQRAMILGLQKDLERALKEKERYRKKWKDNQSSTSAPPLVQPAPEKEITNSSPAQALNVSTTSSVSSRNVSSHSINTTSSSTISAVSTSSTLNATNPPGAQTSRNLPPSSDQQGSSEPSSHPQPPTTKLNEPTTEPIPLKKPFSTPADHPSPLGSISDHTSIEASPITSASLRNEDSTERAQTPLMEPSQVLEASPKEAEVQVFKFEKHRPTHISILNTTVSPPPAEAAPRAPSLAVINPTPTIDSGSFPSPPKASFGSRRSVPAPLNLTQSNLSPNSQQLQFADQSPIIAVRVDEKISDDVERGRRRTREADDRAREVIAIREEEAHSMSNKAKSKSKSKSATTTPIASPTVSGPHSALSVQGTLATIPLPSPRLPTAASGRPIIDPTTLLSPSVSESSISSTTAQRSSLVVPLLSPGLPLSPRPGHKPANSPSPRHPKQQLSVSSTPSVKKESPHRTPSSADDSRRKSSESPRPATPLIKEAIEEEEVFSSPSAVPAPLFAKKSNSASPSPRSIPPGTDKSTVLSSSESSSQGINGRDSPDKQDDLIYRGFVSDQYPDLLLPPNALPLIDVRVFSSRLRPSRNSVLLAKPLDEDPVFLLGIYSRSDRKQLWRLEKTIHALPSLHNRVKSVSSFAGKLPDPSLFQGHAPAKIDARRAALNAYFDMLLDTPLTEDAALVVCHFFSTDVIDPELENIPTVPKVASIKARSSSAAKEPPRREGYLTKRGKNFGGWKARYFILDGPELKYYDDQSGPQVGIIRLINAQIGKQTSSASNQSPAGRDDEDNQYRHAFLILEPKKRDSSSVVRHVLCAESDEERDAWVAACLSYVNYKSEKKARESSIGKHQADGSIGSTASTLPTIVQSRMYASTSSSVSSEKPLQDGSRERGTPSSVNSSNKENHEPQSSRLVSIPPERNTGSPQPPFLPQINVPSDVQDEQPHILGVSYEQTIQAEAPIIGQTSYHSRASHIPANPKAHKDITISGPTNGAPIQNMEMWGLKTPTPAKEKKRSIFAFRGRSSSDLNIPQGKDGPSTPGLDSRPPPRNVFGIPLLEAVECSQPVGVDIFLPAVVYRCIEYLRDREAIDEEGIFRLSGSNVAIRGLRERFTQEGDVRLLDEEYYDIHAVASLLKLYLRELPNSILSRDLHLDFLKVNDLTDHGKKVAVCNVLVHKLPLANLTLLDNLCGFLIEVVDNSDKNKMNVRNGKF